MPAECIRAGVGEVEVDIWLAGKWGLFGEQQQARLLTDIELKVTQPLVVAEGDGGGGGGGVVEQKRTRNQGKYLQRAIRFA